MVGNHLRAMMDCTEYNTTYVHRSKQNPMHRTLAKPQLYELHLAFTVKLLLGIAYGALIRKKAKLLEITLLA